MVKKILYKGDWVSLVKIDGYECLDEPNIVIVLPYDDNGVYIRDEYCPCHEGRLITVISGKIEGGEIPEDTVIRECYEEAGIVYSDKEDGELRIGALAENLPICKSSNMKAYVFIYDVNGLNVEEPKGDGTENEKKSKTVKISWDELDKYFQKGDMLLKYLLLEFGFVE